MKRLIMCLAGGPLLAVLAACGQPSDSANQETAAENVQALPDEALLNDAAGAEQTNAEAPAQRPPDAEKSIPPAPPAEKPKAPKAPPPVNDDPHAGHDMSNMANQQ